MGGEKERKGDLSEKRFTLQSATLSRHRFRLLLLSHSTSLLLLTTQIPTTAHQSFQRSDL